MLAQQQGFNHIRLTVLEDIENLAPRLRFEDKREILSSIGLTPYLNSTINAWEIEADGTCIRIVDLENLLTKY